MPFVRAGMKVLKLLLFREDSRVMVRKYYVVF